MFPRQLARFALSLLLKASTRDKFSTGQLVSLSNMGVATGALAEPVGFLSFILMRVTENSKSAVYVASKVFEAHMMSIALLVL
jgi:hypothetical protein